MKPSVYTEGSDSGLDAMSLMSNPAFFRDTTLPLYDDGACRVRTGGNVDFNLISLFLIQFLIGLTEVFSIWDSFTPQGTFGNVWRHF